MLLSVSNGRVKSPSIAFRRSNKALHWAIRCTVVSSSSWQRGTAGAQTGGKFYFPSGSEWIQTPDHVIIPGTAGWQSLSSVHRPHWSIWKYISRRHSECRWCLFCTFSDRALNGFPFTQPFKRIQSLSRTENKIWCQSGFYGTELLLLQTPQNTAMAPDMAPLSTNVIHTSWLTCANPKPNSASICSSS